MKKPDGSHNLLVVSDFHMAEGLIAEAGEHFYGHEAFLYDSSFVRFLRYHQDLKRGAQQSKARKLPQNEILRRNWRLVLNGDIFDFWDIAQVPGNLEELVREIERAIAEFEVEGFSLAVGWLNRWKSVFAVGPVGQDTSKPGPARGIKEQLTNQCLQNRDYQTIRQEIDALKITSGRHRRSLEALAWWIEVLIHKPGFKLSKSESRHGPGTTWREVVWKLTRIYRGHREFFAGLAWFLARGNEIVLLKGNHDLELHWRQIHNEHLPHLLMDAYQDIIERCPIGPGFDEFPPGEIGTLPGPKTFRGLLPKRYTYQDWFYCEADRVYIEHGNQYEPLDSSVNFLDPKLPSDPKKIELPWGGLMVRYVYNKIVAVHPFSVNIKPEERIIHWMISHDLIRIIGVLLTALPDIFRAIGRAIEQGLRGKWIWGDRSFLGLIPRLANDIFRLVNPEMWNADQGFRRVHNDKFNEIVEAYSPPIASPKPGDLVQSANAEGVELRVPRIIHLSRFLVHLGFLGVTITLVVSGVCWLAQIENPSLIGLCLGISGAVAIAGILLGVKSRDPEINRQVLGENLLQHGAVGSLVGVIACVFLSRLLGWSPTTVLLVILAPALMGAIGSWLIVETQDNWKKAIFPTMISGGWPATVLHSSVSVLRELSLVALLASIYFILKPREGMEVIPWLLTSIALVSMTWLARGMFVNYVERENLASLAERRLANLRRWTRIVANILIGVLVPASVIIAAAKTILPDLPNARVSAALELANRAYSQLTFEKGTQDTFPPLVVLPAAIVVTILSVKVIHQLIDRGSAGRLHSGIRKVGARVSADRLLAKLDSARSQRDVVADQLRAIEELARKEQLGFLINMFKVLNFLLPALAIAFLVIVVLGLGAAVLPFATYLNPARRISIGVLASILFWVIRQVGASLQRHDPESGFRDLFERTARNISQVLSTQGKGLGRPYYFIFGHDHWADSKPIDDQPDSPPGESRVRKRWYVNSGTWLRGYVEEQRRQEVNENHSTFIQVLPGWGEDAAPRVFRWNDDVHEPEPIIRREEPRSADQLLWERWLEDWKGQVIWLVLFVATALSHPEWMWGLLPYLWAIGLGVAISLFVTVMRGVKRVMSASES